jgi:hypothetical protein
MRNFAACLFLATLWQPQSHALSEPDQVLLKSVLKIVLAAHLPTASNKTFALDQVHQQVVQATHSLRKIAANSETLRKILTVRNGLYTKDGDLLRAILVTAAKTKTDRDALITGLKYEKCKKWFWECKIPPFNFDKLQFKFFSTLKSDLDALEERLIQINVLENNDLSKFNPRVLDEYDALFKLFVQLEPLLGQLNSFLFEYYAQKSLRDLNEIELREILEKLILFLNDNENGALEFIRKAYPRS